MLKRFLSGAFAAAFLFTLCFFAGCKGAEPCADKIYIQAEYYDNGVIGGLLTVDYLLKEEKQNVISFNCYPKAFNMDAEISPLEDKENAGDFRILYVKNGEKDLSWEFSGEGQSVLKVDISDAAVLDGRVSVSVKFVCVLPKGDERMGVNESAVNLGNWFLMPAPYVDGEFVECAYGKIGDPFVSDCVDFNVKITVPSTYVVASSGKPATTDVSGERTQYAYALKNARDFAFCLSKKFEVAEQKWGNKSVIYCFYGDTEAERTLNLAVKALEYFSKRFGEYPYETFTLCQTEFKEGGMEYPALVYLSDKLEVEDRYYALVHEIAHQWWYAVVGNDQTKEAYLDEGLAEYSTLLFFKNHRDYGVDSEEYLKTAKNQVETCEEILLKNGKGRLKLVRDLSEYKNDYEYAVTAYSKGLLTFCAMEEFLGEKKFLSALKTYYDGNAYKIADTDDLKNAFKNCEKIIDYFVYGG